ncbi:MAG: transporter substrate-binding domain-containing protein [Thermodesulfobacteriota bacterium]
MLGGFVRIGLIVLLSSLTFSYAAADLKQIKESGAIRHLGVPYANFVTGDGGGLDVEIIKLYAKEIGVKYVYVPSSWATVITDLSGKRVLPNGDDVDILGESPVKGDIIGNGLTFLPWRAKVIDYSRSYFPTAIWVLTKATSELRPIHPSGEIEKDVAATKELLAGKEVMGIRNTCVDPALYNIKDTKPLYKDNIGLNDLAAVVIQGDAPLCILDVPDALIALGKFPGKVKVLGPVSRKQFMGFGISKDSPELKASFDSFLSKLHQSGKLSELIGKYYPLINRYFSLTAQE